MRLALLAAFALCACSAGLTPGLTLPDGAVIPIGGTVPDGGVPDGGDAGTDGGADAGDAGCTALSLNTTGIVDNCFANGLSATGSVAVNTASCTVDINTGTGM